MCNRQDITEYRATRTASKDKAPVVEEVDTNPVETGTQEFADYPKILEFFHLGNKPTHRVKRTKTMNEEGGKSNFRRKRKNYLSLRTPWPQEKIESGIKKS